jgi:hypothetical protein
MIKLSPLWPPNSCSIGVRGPAQKQKNVTYVLTVVMYCKTLKIFMGCFKEKDWQCDKSLNKFILFMYII